MLSWNISDLIPTAIIHSYSDTLTLNLGIKHAKKGLKYDSLLFLCYRNQKNAEFYVTPNSGHSD